MREQFDGQVEIIGIAGRDSVGAMEAFVSDTGVGALRHVADESGDIWRRYEITSQPAWVFINDDGAASHLLGGLGESGLIDEIEVLLAS